MADLRGAADAGESSNRIGGRGMSEAQRYISRGLTLYTQHRKPASVHFFRLALEVEPGNTLAHYLLGLALQAMGRAEEAHAEWRNALMRREGENAAWAQRMAQRLLEQEEAPASTVDVVQSHMQTA
ncbi:MAG: hypothetical protein JO250_13405 [Armatimonadetes bacterium]|nr:hypothetical protein [Armatimonadota bacterium]